jgi:hypothetical protein
VIIILGFFVLVAYIQQIKQKLRGTSLWLLLDWRLEVNNLNLGYIHVVYIGMFVKKNEY